MRTNPSPVLCMFYAGRVKCCSSEQWAYQLYYWIQWLAACTPFFVQLNSKTFWHDHAMCSPLMTENVFHIASYHIYSCSLCTPNPGLKKNLLAYLHSLLRQTQGSFEKVGAAASPNAALKGLSGQRMNWVLFTRLDHASGHFSRWTLWEQISGNLQHTPESETTELFAVRFVASQLGHMRGRCFIVPCYLHFPLIAGFVIVFLRVYCFELCTCCHAIPRGTA